MGDQRVKVDEEAVTDRVQVEPGRLEANMSLPKVLGGEGTSLTQPVENGEFVPPDPTPAPTQPSAEELRESQARISEQSPQLFYPLDQFGLGRSARYYNNLKYYSNSKK
jgi:hypothetical protein